MKPSHCHADGGLYRLFATGINGKFNGEWVEGILYQDILGGEVRWTSNQRWEERFTKLEWADEPDHHKVIIRDDEDSSIASFTFTREQAGDLYHMIMKSGPQPSALSSTPREFLDWMKRVFQAQSEMVAQGLHIRDHDYPDLLGDVAAFHAKFGHEYIGKPRMLEQSLHDFRVKFHKEEADEYDEEYEKLADAVVRQDRRDILHSLEQQLDALCDLVWVALGSADMQFGRRTFFEAWRRVVAANMAKERAKPDGDDRSKRDAKHDIVKPKGWQPPSHRDLVEDNAIFDEFFTDHTWPDHDSVMTAQEV